MTVMIKTRLNINKWLNVNKLLNRNRMAFSGLAVLLASGTCIFVFILESIQARSEQPLMKSAINLSNYFGYYNGWWKSKHKTLE